MNNNTKAISFWNFLKENTIEIPIIQRDYAQGRLGKENLRKTFLADLKKALNYESPYKDTAMKLDFVYGSIENDNLNPLDGQQRLTTLWLLHWYIALSAGELSEDNCEIFRKFTYETRISSREFCGNLCKPEYFENFDGKDIVGFITKQTWFYSAWKQDPTIQSMLRMLGGTKISDKKGEDIFDGIEEIFQETNEDGFKSYWDRLTTKEVIVFYHLPLKDFGLSDDLYIKMNARGKQLTSFENFKADLIGYITNQAEDESLEEPVRAEWKKLLDPESGIPIMLDTDWTDIFWKNRSNDNRIDEIYFAFLNRFFWNELFASKFDNKYVLKIGRGTYKGEEVRTIENYNRSYDYLNNDTPIYYDLSPYKYHNETIPIELFKRLTSILDRFDSKIPICEWDKNFKFIPRFDNNEVTKLTQIHRIVFFAICKYYMENCYDEASMKKWMRVVWNLVSGESGDGKPQIRDTIAMRSAIEFINTLDSTDIYHSLMNIKNQPTSTDFEERCEEEIDKAKQILNGGQRADGKTWEEIIIEAEKYAFFKGSIRFLFTDGEGNINWNDFDTKWTNVQKYFDENGVATPYKKEAKLLRVFLSRIDSKEGWFGYNKEFWHTYLLNCEYQSAIHYLLTTTQLEIEQTCAKDWINNDSLLQNVLCCYNSWHILNDWQGYSVLTRYSQRRSDATSHKEIIVLNDLRNKLLNEVSAEISPEIKVGNTTYLYGWNINFKYDSHFFQWYGFSNVIKLDVYLMENDWKAYKKRPNPTTDKGTDEDNYYCFKVDEADSSDSFVEKLDNLIKQAKSDLS